MIYGGHNIVNMLKSSTEVKRKKLSHLTEHSQYLLVSNVYKHTSTYQFDTDVTKITLMVEIIQRKNKPGSSDPMKTSFKLKQIIHFQEKKM